MKNFFKMAIVASALVSVIGCQSTAEEPSSVTEKNTLIPSISTFNELNKQYSLDKVAFDSVDEFKIYSEEVYQNLIEEWDEAKELFAEIEREPGLTGEEYSMFSSGSYAAKYMSLVASADAEFSKLKKYKKNADVVLSGAIAQMAYLKSMKVNKYFSEEYLELNEQYKELFVVIVEDDIAEAQTEQAEFLTSAKVLEIRAALKIHVEPLEKEFSSLSNDGFKAVAPISYGQTKAELEKTKKAVQANNRDIILVTDVVAKTRFQLAHLKNMAAEVKLLQAVKKGKFEQPVLEFENKLLAISHAINGDDYRDQPLRIQTELILSAVQQMHEINNTVDLEDKIKELNSQVGALETTVETQTNDRAAVQKQIVILTQQLDRNDHLIDNLNAVISSFKEKEKEKEKELKEAQLNQVKIESVEKKEAVVSDKVTEIKKEDPKIE